MIRRHIDLIAIGLLLCGIAFFSATHRAIEMGLVSQKCFSMHTDFRPRVVAVPAIPRIPYTRD